MLKCYNLSRKRKNMTKITIKTEYITLSQFLKLSNIIQSGGEAKLFIINNNIFVNGEMEKRKGKKLYKNDHIQISNKEFVIC